MKLAARTEDRPFNPSPTGAPDRRRHRRFAIALLGRFMRADRHEYPCKLVDISVEGAAMNAPVALEIGERVVAYFDRIGGLEGRVVRVFDGGFAVELITTAHKREKLAAQIAGLASSQECGRIESRRHVRLALGNKSTTIKINDEILAAVVIDVSISGASVRTQARPAIGSEIMLGRLRARVVRHHSDGIGLEFMDIQNPDAVRRHFG